MGGIQELLSARVGSAEVVTLKCDGSSGRNDEMVVPHRPRYYRISTLAFNNVTKIKVTVSPAASYKHVDVGIFGSSQTRTPGTKDHEVKARFHVEEEKWNLVWTFDHEQGNHGEEQGKEAGADADAAKFDEDPSAGAQSSTQSNHASRSTGFFYIMVASKEADCFYEINAISKVVHTNQKIEHHVQNKRLRKWEEKLAVFEDDANKREVFLQKMHAVKKKRVLQALACGKNFQRINSLGKCLGQC